MQHLSTSFVCLALGFFLGAIAPACRDDTTVTDTGNPVDVAADTAHADVGRDTAMPGDAGVDVQAPMDVQMPTDVVVADSGCSTPSTLHPPSADAGTRNLYCPFSGVDGGSAMYCNAATQHCCEPSGTGTAACQPTATACATGDTDWQCEDPGVDCPAAHVCCATGTLVIASSPVCGNYASGFHGTHCATSCTTAEVRMCTSTAQCPAGMTCVPFKAKGNSVGGCH